MPASLKLWANVSQSEIAHGAFAQMRGGNTRTDNPPRVSFFIFIVKAEMEFVCLTYKRRHNIHLYSREADSLPYQLTFLSSLFTLLSSLFSSSPTGENE